MTPPSIGFVPDNTFDNKAACAGMTRPFGDGGGDTKYSEIFKTLKEIDYQGWLVVEQERAINKASTVKADLAKSRIFLR